MFIYSCMLSIMTESRTQNRRRELQEVEAIHQDRIRLARESMLESDEADLLARQFKVLSDPGRLRIIYALLEVGEMCVGEIAAAVGASESGTSHQLRQLRMGGLVSTRKSGRSVHYRVADTHVRLLLDVAVEHYLHDHGSTS